MEELLEKIQRKQNDLIEKYFKEKSEKTKEEIRKQLYLLCNKYVEIGKNLNIEEDWVNYEKFYFRKIKKL